MCGDLGEWVPVPQPDFDEVRRMVREHEERAARFVGLFRPPADFPYMMAATPEEFERVKRIPW